MRTPYVSTTFACELSLETTSDAHSLGLYSSEVVQVYGEKETKPFLSNKRLSSVIFLTLLIFGIGLVPALAGDALYGKVTKVNSPLEMIFDYGDGKYEIRLVGIDVPKNLADSAVYFVSKMILGKNARIRFEGRTPDEKMLVRLFTDDSIIGIKEVAIELVKVGLAQRLKNYDFKYGELEAAERDARKSKLGLWGTKNK